MKQISLRTLSFYSAFITGGTAFLFSLPVLLLVTTRPYAIMLSVVFAFLIGIITGMVFTYYVRNFVNNRIRALYKAIYNVKTEEGMQFYTPDNSDDGILEMETEVAVWMKTRSTEIDNLKKLEHYRREFLGNVSHELKTPIFNIQGYIATLLDGGLEDPQINRNYLQRAEKSVERMIHIVSDLESISRIESGEMILEKEQFDISQLAKEVFEAQEMKADAKKISLRFRGEFRSVKVFADKERIRQVFTNLVTNSIKYGKENGETEIRFHDMEDQILVEVADNGIGIGKDHLPRVFERFYRVDKGRSRDQGGTGLGLAIVKHILEAHGQTVNVRSSEGIGSTFSFTLPVFKQNSSEKTI
jgi:two-component system, OmpR family, phosphate regulon sensor histidine kinase PhoR